MAHQFTKHYALDEARALLPQLRLWLNELRTVRERIARQDERFGRMLDQGCDLGGELVNDWLRQLAVLRKLLHHFELREIQVKDIERGLLDFPAIIGGREVFLCWEQDEDDIEYWHDIETGYAGREKLRGEEPD